MVEPEKLDEFLEANPLPLKVTPAPMGLPTIWLARARLMRQTLREMFPDVYGRTYTDNGIITAAEYIKRYLAEYGNIIYPMRVYILRDAGDDQYFVHIGRTDTNSSASLPIIEPLKDFPSDYLITKLQIFA